jgi:hypothetical protein
MFAIFVIILSLALLIFYWDAGCRRSLYSAIQKVVSDATTELLIVDPDVDRLLWALLTRIPPSVRVRLLTDRTTADFLLRAKKFVARHGNWVEIRQTKEYHDCFIALDGNTCWHLGASVKSRGLLLTLWPLPSQLTLLKFKRQELVKVVIGDIENVWASSPSVHT